MSIYFYGCTTLDGYLADKNHRLDWLYETGSVEKTGYEVFYSKMDFTIMGRRTFDEIAKADNSDSFYPTTKNYVFTNDKNFEHTGFIPIQGDIVTFMKSLDRSKNVWVVGGNQILAPLLDQNMLDEMIIQIAPVLLGKGIPLFTQKESVTCFSLEEVNKYGQFAELVYRKKNNNNCKKAIVKAFRQYSSFFIFKTERS